MQKIINLAKKRLEDGNLVIFPTETVYGLGGDATNLRAIKKIYNLKKRPLENPLICHFKNIKEIKENFEINSLDNEIIKKFCPGPLTIILKKRKKCKIHTAVSNNLNYIGCRIPKNKIAINILKSVNFPIAAPSANISTKISPTQTNHISKKLKDNTLIINGGKSLLGLESTVVKTSKNKILILRLGSISIEEIRKKIPNNDIEIKNLNQKVSPGNQKKHYAPNLPIRINVTKVLKNEGLLNFGKNNMKSNICEYNLSAKGSLKEASKNFFNFFFLIDNNKLCKGIAVAPIPSQDLGITINDRLKRASYKK